MVYDGATMGAYFPIAEEPSFLDKVQVCCVLALHVACDGFEFPEVSSGTVWLVESACAIEVVGNDFKVLDSRHVQETLRISPVIQLKLSNRSLLFSICEDTSLTIKSLQARDRAGAVGCNRYLAMVAVAREAARFG